VGVQRALASVCGVLGAALAVAIATLFWLAATAVVLTRLSGLRTDVVCLLVSVVSARGAPA